MRRTAFHVLVMLALLFQGVNSVGADFSSPDHQSQQHCADHDMSAQDCVCCPEGVADTNCTVQCSVLQAPEMVQAPTRLELLSGLAALPEAAVPSRFYAPIDPPPIS